MFVCVDCFQNIKFVFVVEILFVGIVIGFVCIKFKSIVFGGEVLLLVYKVVKFCLVEWNLKCKIFEMILIYYYEKEDL